MKSSTTQEEAKERPPQIIECTEISCEDWDEFIELLSHANNRLFRLFPDGYWRASDIVVEM